MVSCIASSLGRLVRVFISWRRVWRLSVRRPGVDAVASLGALYVEVHDK